MDNLNKRWEEFLSDIQPQVPAISYDMWLKKLEPINIIDRVFYIRANNMIKNVCNDKFSSYS